MSLESFINEHTQKLRALYRPYTEAYWEFTTGGGEEAKQRSAEYEMKIRNLYSDKANYQKLISFPKDTDAVIERQRKVMSLAFQANLLPPETIAELVKREKEIESVYNEFRAELDGEKVPNNKIQDILHQSTDNQLRQKAWEASKLIGIEVHHKLLDLVKLRNASARSLGFENYYYMNLELAELDRDFLFDVLDDLEKQSQKPFQVYKERLDAQLAKKFGISPNELMPWHYSDPFFQEAPAADVDLDKYFKDKKLEDLAKAFYQDIGMEIDDILQRSDLYERDGKDQHAYCIHIEPTTDDVRMLCNLRSNSYWMSTLLHELGHAVYDKYIDNKLPFVLAEPAHTLSTEAIAILMEQFLHNGAWLTKYAGVAPKEAAELEEVLFKQRAAKQAVFVRWGLVMVYFERELYRDPDQNLNKLWWDLVHRLQMVTPPPGRNTPDWAAKIHIACAPVYYQNYILGYLMAEHLADYIKSNILKSHDRGLNAMIGKAEVGKFLKDKIFTPGGIRPWNEALALATNKPLDPKPMVNNILEGLK